MPDSNSGSHNTDAKSTCHTIQQFKLFLVKPLQRFANENDDICYRTGIKYFLSKNENLTRFLPILSSNFQEPEAMLDKI